MVKGSGEKSLNAGVLIIGGLLVLAIIGLSLSFLFVALEQNRGLSDRASEIDSLTLRLDELNTTLQNGFVQPFNATLLQAQIDALQALLEALNQNATLDFLLERITLVEETQMSQQMQIQELFDIINVLIMDIGNNNATLHDEIAIILGELAALQMQLNDAQTALLDALNGLNMTLQSDLADILLTLTVLNMTLQSQHNAQEAEIALLQSQLSLLQSQFNLFLSQYQFALGGGGGNGSQVPESGSFFVNFNDTTFDVQEFTPLGCCVTWANTISSQRTNYFVFDYLHRGILLGTPNVTTTILQNYAGTAFRMIDGITLPPGAYNIDLFMNVSVVFLGSVSNFWISWIPNTLWNTPFGIDFSLMTAPFTNDGFSNYIYTTNRIATITITNPAGTYASYMSTNNFFLSHGTESLFIMWSFNPLTAGEAHHVINSFNVHFNKM